VVGTPLFAPGVNDLGGRAPLDVVVGVDSLDVFMLTGLTLDIPGCSPPSRARLSPTMHALYGFIFHDVFTSRLRFSQL